MGVGDGVRSGEAGYMTDDLRRAARVGWGARRGYSGCFTSWRLLVC